MRTHILPKADEDEERRINEGIAADPDNPEWTDEMFARARRGVPPEIAPLLAKRQVTLRLDPDVIAHFKGETPRGWQTRINDALRQAAGLPVTRRGPGRPAGRAK